MSKKYFVFINELHANIKPSLLQRKKQGALQPKNFTFYKSFKNEEKRLSLYLPIQKHFERIFFAFFTFITGKEKSPSLSMGLQRHFDHPKFAPFTNCLYTQVAYCKISKDGVTWEDMLEMDANEIPRVTDSTISVEQLED